MPNTFWTQIKETSHCALSNELIHVREIFSETYESYLTPIKLDLIYGEVFETSLFVLDRKRKKSRKEREFRKKE